MQNPTFLTEIPESEQKDFDKFVQDSRRKFILLPKDAVKAILQEYSALMMALQKDRSVSAVIRTLRGEAFSFFSGLRGANKRVSSEADF